jgi:hypothetical protein
MGKRRGISFSTTFIHGPAGAEEGGGGEWILLDSPFDSPSSHPDFPTLPFPVAVKLGKSDDGRLVCIGMKLGLEALTEWEAQDVVRRPSPPPVQITSKTLREIPMGEILDHLAAWRTQPFLLEGGFVEVLDAAVVESDAPRVHPGSRGHPLAFYEGIRDLYREALVESPGHVYRYVVEHAVDADGRPMYDVKTETAAFQKVHQATREAAARRWVKKAREKGLLGSARHGTAGEYHDEGPSR